MKNKIQQAMIKLSTIKLNPRNPRLIKDDKFRKLVESIKKFPKMMELRPIVIDEENVIQGGNMRFRALKELGFNEIPEAWVKQGKDLTEEEWREFVVKDNVPFGEWEWDILANEWDAQELADWGLEIPNFEATKIDAVEDDYEIPDKIKTDIALGDLFEIGQHRLLCGDSTDSEQVARLMNGQKADMVFTDPPYDLEDNYSQNIFDLAKEDSHIFIMNSDRLLVENVNNGYSWFRKFFAVDFRQARLVSNNQPMTRVDLIAEFCKGKTKFNNLHDGFSTLIECCKVRNDNEEINFGFNQAKRIELPSTFIQHYSNKNELIVDLFGGAGSTIAASEQLGRRCYIMEFEPKNCQIIINRMKEKYNLMVNKIAN
jgi:DNA modification methylase